MTNASVDMALTHKNKKFSKRLNNYIDRFMGMKLAPDMLLNKLFPDSKEITESFGMLEAVKMVCRIKDIKLSDPSVTCLVVGDGHNPRTGALVSFSSLWQVESIDPQMRVRSLRTTDGTPFQRLKLTKERIADIEREFSHVFILHPHSHAKLTDSLISIRGRRRHLISMPCCVPDNIEEPDFTYQDKYVHSPKNTINVWMDI